MKKKLSLIFALAVLGSNVSAMSVNSDRIYDTQVESRYPVSFSISTGVLNGESEEYAYSNYFGKDGKESKLTWDLKNVFMVGAETSISVSDRVSFNVGGWINASDGSGDMSNYDWRTGDDSSWTDKSDHGADLEEALMLDINIDVVLINRENYNVSGVLGFRHDKFRWNAYNGSGVYSYNDIGEDKLDGFPYEDGKRIQDVESYGKAISYKQELYAPYIGANFNYSQNKWKLNTYVRASMWAWGEATDTHYNPSSKYTLNDDFRGSDKGDSRTSEKGEKNTIKDEVEDMFYLSFGLGVEYQFTERLSAGISADFQKYNKEEDSDKKDYEYNYRDETYEGWGGMSHVSYMFSASLKYIY